ncbi:MAG: glycosyltransferase family 2 protein [Anaerolineae bacterium]|nr:glycosyltransferase family 2 protein [Anaerolineae bacterium]
MTPDHKFIKTLVNHKIAVIIPAYNAEKHLEKVVNGIPSWINQIFIIEDCSKDNTLEVANTLGIQSERIIVICHEKNQGVGGAMITGYDAACLAGADILIKMDSDNQMNPAYLPQLLETLMQGPADYVKGNRFVHSRSLTAMPLIRRIGNIGLSFLTKLASGYWNIFDPSNGYTAIWSDVYQNMQKENIAPRFFFETSMLLELGLIQAVTKDVYIPARYGDEKSSLSELDVLIKFPIPLLKSFLNRIVTQYFIRDFTALSILTIMGLFGSVFGFCFGIYHWIKSTITGIPTLTGTVMVAVIPLILGIQFLLQALILDIQNVPKIPLHQQKKQM